MKKFLLTLTILFISSVVHSAEYLDNVTCALSRTTVGERVSSRAKATEFIVYKSLGSMSLFGKKTYRSKGQRYRASAPGEGLIVRKLVTGTGAFKFEIVNRGIEDVIDLNGSFIVDRTTGGYPGTGPAPTRKATFKCRENYDNILNVSKVTVIADFNL